MDRKNLDVRRVDSRDDGTTAKIGDSDDEGVDGALRPRAARAKELTRSHPNASIDWVYLDTLASKSGEEARVARVPSNDFSQYSSGGPDR